MPKDRGGPAHFHQAERRDRYYRFVFAMLGWVRLQETVANYLPLSYVTG